MKLGKRIAVLGVQALGFSMCFTNAAFAAPVNLNSNIAMMRAELLTGELKTDGINLQVSEKYMIPNSIIEGDADLSKLRYSTDNWDIAGVNSRTGIITAKSAGTCTITVTSSGELLATLDVTVRDKTPVEGVVFKTKEISMVRGGMNSVAASVLPEDATDKKVKYSSSDTSVATVSQSSGLVRAVGGGTCTITATSVGNPEAKDTCVVTVSDIAVTDIILDKSEIAVAIGEKALVNAMVVPSDASSPRLKYASSNTDIATVSSVGSITGRSAGECEVTVSGGGIVKTCKVKVTPDIQVEGVEFNSTKLSVPLGGIEMVSVQVLPENATNKKIRYTSSDPEIASVGGRNGVVKAKKPGTCIITATSEDGNKTAECEVTVSTAVENLEIANAEVFKSLEEYTSTPLEVKSYPETSASEKLSFSSSDANVAEVDEASGMVTAKGLGECVITVQAPNGVKTSQKIKVTPAPLGEIKLLDITLGDGQRTNLYEQLEFTTSTGRPVLSSDDCFAEYIKDMEFVLVPVGDYPCVVLEDNAVLYGFKTGKEVLYIYYKKELKAGLLVKVGQ